MSASEFCILPCSGLDKSLGQITRSSALTVMAELPDLELLCPVVLTCDRERYRESLETKKLIVIDGCGTRCATKIAGKAGASVALKLYVPEVAKKIGRKPEPTLEAGPQALEVASEISRIIIQHCRETPGDDSPGPSLESWENRETDFHETMIDKFILKVPKEGYLFNENDCWAFIMGPTALVGITDYFQTNAGDVMFVGVPEEGKEINQFDEAGDFESSKAVLQVISPVSGVVVRANNALKEHPELLNEDPYRRGWVVELRLTQPEEDRELLLESDAYFSAMVKKAQKEMGGAHHTKGHG